MAHLRLGLVAAVCASACVDSGAATSTGTGTGMSTSTSDTGTDTSTETGDPPLDFDADIQPVLESACICHFTPNSGGSMTAPYLNLNAGDAVAQLVDVDAVQVPGMKRVVAGDLDASYLVHKLRGTHVDVGGPIDSDRMPPLAALSDEQIMMIEAWILAGANP